jgi:two-component system response regulator AlgR
MTVSGDEKRSILIVDDEPLAGRRLQMLCDRIENTGQCDMIESGHKALERVTANCPDIMLLDIDMPGITGIEIADRCKKMDRAPKIIFTTAHSKYAVRAFRLEAVDYLLKPVKLALLAEALQRAFDQLERDGHDGGILDHILWVKDGETSLQIRSTDIERIEAERDYMKLCLPGRSYLIHESMQSLQSKLPKQLFVRVHRSSIVRKDLIHEVRRKGRGRYVILRDGTEMAVGRRYADAVMSGNSDQTGGLGLSETVRE